ncbi:hypothetical protein C8J57DRAFT_1534919 [Mycena rebaudengoi]|nr:hypothetical protein C8J57DRAFT_1534919 [Mycena rebaudengoi]
MNSFYDINAAKKSIDRLAAYMAIEQLALKKDYCIGPAHMVDINNVTAKEVGFPKFHKAVMKDHTGDAREITFTVVGMLLDMELPPVKRGKLNTRNIPFFRQHATIAGLGTDKFVQAIQKVMQVAVEVELAFDDDHVLPWSPSAGTVELGDIFQTSSNVLSNTLAKGISHCRDNEVKYMDLDSEGDRLVPKNPSGFRIGDIVELGFSVVAFKDNNDSKAVVKLVMRSLTFLDGTQTRDARVPQRMASVKADRKRLVGREEPSDEEDARRAGPIVSSSTNDETEHIV